MRGVLHPRSAVTLKATTSGCPQNAAAVPWRGEQGQRQLLRGQPGADGANPGFCGRWDRARAVPAVRDEDPGDAPGNRSGRSPRGVRAPFLTGKKKKNTAGLSELVTADFARNDFKPRVFLDKPGGTPMIWAEPPQSLWQLWEGSEGPASSGGLFQGEMVMEGVAG